MRKVLYRRGQYPVQNAPSLHSLLWHDVFKFVRNRQKQKEKQNTDATTARDSVTFYIFWRGREKEKEISTLSRVSVENLIRWIPCEFAHFFTSPLRFPSNFIGIIFGMFLDYTNHFWPQLTTFDPLNWHFKIFCNFKGYKFANFKEVQRPSYKSYWPNFFLTMSKKVQFAKKNRKKKKNTFLMDTRPKTAKWLRPKKIKHYPLRFLIKIDIS